MLAKKLTSLLAACIAVTATWLALPDERATAHAWELGILDDSDNDFLPNCVEWAVMTNSASPDTDGDGTGDFVEVVQRGQPRQPGAPLASDQEMRIVVTGPGIGVGPQTAWVHLFFRFVGATPPISNFDVWVDLPQYPGIRIPLAILAAGAIVFRDRVTAQDGYWAQVSVPIVSLSFLQLFLPCSFNAEAMIGGRYVHSGVQVIDMNGVVSTLVPYGDHFAIQTVTPIPLSPTAVSNRVCLIELEEIGSGPGGTIYRVADAFCDDCNELECDASCPLSIGWILTIPGGLATLGG